MLGVTVEFEPIGYKRGISTEQIKSRSGENLV